MRLRPLAAFAASCGARLLNVPIVRMELQTSTTSVWLFASLCISAGLSPAFDPTCFGQQSSLNNSTPVEPDEGTNSATSADSSRRQLVDGSIQRGIRYLISKQREDGAIVDRQHDTTMSALSIMAMASIGVTPSVESPEGIAAREALDFVLRPDRQDDKGYFGNRDGSRMYGHGITTLMLTEMLGMGANAEQDLRIHDQCQRAIDLILSAQKQRKNSRYQGGWRYTPNSNDADLSVSVWQLLALRSAKNDGLEVPVEAIEKAVTYLNNSFTSPLNSSGLPLGDSGGFSYLPDNRKATFAMTAAGALAMQICGQYESPLVEHATKWLVEHPPKWDDRFFFYGTYYYAQAMHQRGGSTSKNAHQIVSDLLLAHQNPDGSWAAEGGEEQGAGRVYTTCMAILSLSVNHHYLPIYQR
ncbi:MAG: prenyltransferase/squalene oxidase repeat-containing protein [Aureliella sp.]